MSNEKKFSELKDRISKDVKIIKEMNSLLTSFHKEGDDEKPLVLSQIKLLKNSLKKENTHISRIIKEISFPRSLPITKTIIEDQPKKVAPRIIQNHNSTRFMKKPLVEKKRKETIKKEKRIPIGRERLSIKLFSNFASRLINQGRFKKIDEELLKANMRFLPKVYLSMILFSTLLAFLIAIFITIFLLFFNLISIPPFITIYNGNILIRFSKIFWLLFVIPIGTFTFMYFYPSLEKKSLERKINQELPFATINMSAISSSLADPTKIFSIIILTKEYPTLEKEFVKIINGVNVLGKDLITVLREGGFSSPSKKLSDLFNGLATTINSGGDLPKFFEERANNLLFQYKIEQEKETRSAETFMDIYISVVIAAPMILMLLMIMIQISGLGISLSIFTITLIMVLGVTLINIVFLTFLHLKQPKN